MKKSLMFILIIMALSLCACGNESSKSDEKDSFVVRATYLKEEDDELKRKNVSAGTLAKNTFWVEKKENIHDFLDAIKTGDQDFFEQQIREGKIYHVDKDTKIHYSNDRLNDGAILQITFLQGRYKNKKGYTLSNFIYEQ